MIEKTQSFASGGWAPDEEFVVPNKGLMGESLTKTHAHFETPCGSYAHFKLARDICCASPERRDTATAWSASSITLFWG